MENRYFRVLSSSAPWQHHGYLDPWGLSDRCWLMSADYQSRDPWGLTYGL